MSKLICDFLIPVGRFVEGAIYISNTTDIDNKPLVYKSGKNTGQPRVEFYFAVAIAKDHNSHWASTVWGSKIYNPVVSSFPNGQTNNPGFSWKIVDGDSQEVNTKGRRFCDKEGFAGHWIVKFKNGFAPKVWDVAEGKYILEPEFVKPGDYIEVSGNIVDNTSIQKPGIILNHEIIGFRHAGRRINLGIDPKNIGFGVSELPAGAHILGASDIALPNHPINSMPVQPYPDILNPVTNIPTMPTIPIIPSVPKKIMTAKAKGATYEAFIAEGWSDSQLIQYGMMEVK